MIINIPEVMEYSFSTQYDTTNRTDIYTLPCVSTHITYAIFLKTLHQLQQYFSTNYDSIKMFDDHFTVESPGMLPGLVRTNNIREIHFSRNPKIFEFLHEYEYVKEFEEGVDRMFREMEDAGLPEPEYRIVEFMLYATLKNQKWMESQKNPKDTATFGQVAVQVTGQVDEFAAKKQELLDFCSIPRSRKEMQMHLGLTGRNHFNDTYLRPLLAAGKLKMTIPDKPSSRNQKYIKA